MSSDREPGLGRSTVVVTSRGRLFLLALFVVAVAWTADDIPAVASERLDSNLVLVGNRGFDSDPGTSCRGYSVARVLSTEVRNRHGWKTCVASHKPDRPGATLNSRSQQAIACRGRVVVDDFEVDVARSRVSCAKAKSVAHAAYEDFVAKPWMGNHGIFGGFKCRFDLASTPDFSRPRGPILFCKSWNRYVVGSAEPTDPPTTWSFVKPVLSGPIARRYAVSRAVRWASVPWRRLSHRRADCSSRISKFARDCRLSWSKGHTRYKAAFRVRMTPQRWGPPIVKVLGGVTRLYT